MHDQVGDDCADDHTRRAHQHDQHTPPHYPYDRRDVDFDQHQDDECR